MTSALLIPTIAINMRHAQTLQDLSHAYVMMDTTAMAKHALVCK